jgi:hypothetical protein
MKPNHESRDLCRMTIVLAIDQRQQLVRAAAERSMSEGRPVSVSEVARAALARALPGGRGGVAA